MSNFSSSSSREATSFYKFVVFQQERPPSIIMKVSTSTVCALLVFVAISLAIPAPLPQPVSYDGIKVVRINLDSTSSQAQAVSNLIQRLKLETWTDVVKPNHAVDIMVSPEKLAAFDQDLSGIGVTYKTMHEDLGASIRAESEPAVKTFDGMLISHRGNAGAEISLKLGNRRRICRGSTRTIVMPTISRIFRNWLQSSRGERRL